MDCGIAGGEPAFSAQKTRSRSQKERNRKWELWTLLFFSKNFIEVWLIFSVALSSSAQQCDSVIHIKTIQSFKNVYSFSWGLSLDTEYSSLRSTVGLFFFFYHFAVSPTPSPPLPNSLPHGNSMPCPILDELSHPLLLINPLDTCQKREIKPRIVLGLNISGSRR